MSSSHQSWCITRYGTPSGVDMIACHPGFMSDMLLRSSQAEKSQINRGLKQVTTLRIKRPLLPSDFASQCTIAHCTIAFSTDFILHANVNDFFKKATYGTMVAYISD
eukprot:scaffold168297_cov14-Prasinocladus_malaysianus.AAC.1